MLPSNLHNGLAQPNPEPGNNRRNFLKNGAVLGAALMAAPGLLSSATGNALGAGAAGPTRLTAPPALPHRTLGQGKARFDVTSLGFGCMGMSYHRGPEMV